MNTEINTRRVHRDIKALDKTTIAAERIRQSHVRTKDSTEQTQEHATPVEYAEDRVAGGADTAVRKGVHHARQQGGRLAGAVKEKGRISKEIKQRKLEVQREQPDISLGENPTDSPSGGVRDYLPKEQMKKRSQTQTAKRKARQKALQQMSQGTDVSREGVKTICQGKKSIKTTRQTGQKSVKNTGKSVKTAQRTARTTIKTTEQTARSAYGMAKALRQTAKKTAQGAKQSAKAAKKGAKATVKAVKAIIAATKSLISALAAGGWIVVLLLIIVILFGGFLSMTGGDNSTTVTPVSAEVQAYEPIVRKYAKQHGIGEYVELIKAVMMQESGGRGNDPMQSSEGGFNTKYPRKHNGITDPEYSIDCGVQEIKGCLVSAEVKSPVDMDSIKLALQGYNYGNGYISWAKNHYAGYTLANAAEFSDMMAKKKGWSSAVIWKAVPCRNFPSARME